MERNQDTARGSGEESQCPLPMSDLRKVLLDNLSSQHLQLASTFCSPDGTRQSKSVTFNIFPLSASNVLTESVSWANLANFLEDPCSPCPFLSNYSYTPLSLLPLQGSFWRAGAPPVSGRVVWYNAPQQVGCVPSCTTQPFLISIQF